MVSERMSTEGAGPAQNGDVNVDPGPGKAKLHGRAFYESIGSPKYIVAPMVNQSEFAWRMLTRSFLSPAENAQVLAYTPMLHARLYNEGENYRQTNFQPVRPSTTSNGATSNGTRTDITAETAPEPWLDGNPKIDRPLFVQFCANDPETLLAAAQRVAPHCDAVDLNFGCPQGIARKGHYGAFLQEDQDLIFRLINILHRNLDIPVTAKIRVLDTREATLAYARNVLRAGASILTVHGRRREQKGHLTGLADWDIIRWLREKLPEGTVMFANGNVLQRGDLERCLEATGADGIMSAEGNLSDPSLFSEPPAEDSDSREYWKGRDGRGGWRVDAVVRRYLDILHRYVAGQDPPVRQPLYLPGDEKKRAAEDGTEGPAAKKQRLEDGTGEATAATKEPKKMSKKEKKNKKKGGKSMDPNLSAVQAHLFHLLRHFVTRHTDVRDKLARSGSGDLDSYEEVLAAIEAKVADGLKEYERTEGRSYDEEVAEAERKLARAPTQGEKADGAARSNGEAGAEHEKQQQEQQREGDDAVDGESSVATVRKCRRPWWVVQPIVRPLPKEALAKGAISVKSKDMGKLSGEGKRNGVDDDDAAAAAVSDVEKKVLDTDDKLLAG